MRSPDGESRAYAIGQLSIQRAAVWILQKYYTEFSIYNPYLERLPVSKSRKGGGSSFKFYDVDGVTNNTMQVGIVWLQRFKLVAAPLFTLDLPSSTVNRGQC